MPTRLKIFYHDHCFDGASSAAIFADFYRTRRVRDVSIALQGMQHAPGDPFQNQAIDGDDNVCLDFRYCPDPKMTWWFDHHVSAFQPGGLKKLFEADRSGQKFYDPAARSCAVYCFGILHEKFSYAPDDPHGHWAELVHWADVIDGARWPTALAATDLDQPAMQVMSWIEANRDTASSHELIGKLGHVSLESLAELPFVRPEVARIRREHAGHLELIDKRGQLDVGVVAYDLIDDRVAVHNKFIVYRLFPSAEFAVGLTRGDGRIKISVGYNPWSNRPCQRNIAKLCEEFGGGGHPVVGAVSVAERDVATARRIAAEITERLRTP